MNKYKMAWHKKARKGKPKRKAAPRKRKQPTTMINRSIQPVPARYMCRLKYATNITTTSLGGGWTMNLNSLFDPDRSGLTNQHQPLGFDNLALLYNKYRVISTSWRINRCAGATDPAIQIGCIASNDPSVNYSNFALLKESPRAKYVIQNPSANSIPLTGKVYLPKLLGRTYAQYMADDVTGSEVSGSPAEECILYIQTATANDSIQGNVALSVVMTFDVEFYDMKHLEQS